MLSEMVQGDCFCCDKSLSVNFWIICGVCHTSLYVYIFLFVEMPHIDEVQGSGGDGNDMAH